MTSLAFQQVDVFTAVPFKGNPVAVVLDADELSSEADIALALDALEQAVRILA